MKKRSEKSTITNVQAALIVCLACVLSALLPLTIKSQSLSSTPSLLPGQTATALPDGRLLLLGGESAGGRIDTASIWDPKTGSTTDLASKMVHGRAWHTATVLPDGLVLVLGGVGNNKQVISSAEVFDPAKQTFTNLTTKSVTARAHHSATLLSDGHVLIAGGVGSDGQILPSAELWDGESPSSTTVQSGITPRRSHTATLLGDGRVLLWGGTGATGNPLDNGDLFDPSTGQFTSLGSYPTALVPRPTDAPSLVATIPLDRAVDIDTETMISLRFSKPLRVESVNANTVSLSGPNGIEKIAVVPAENGSLAFLTPEALLLPGATYTATVNGAVDRDGLLLPVSGISFSTKLASSGGIAPSPQQIPSTGLQSVPSAPLPSLTPQSYAGDGWVWRGKLKDGKPHSDWQDLEPLQAPLGITALSGQVLNLAGLPLANIALEVEYSENKKRSGKVFTDETGRFLLSNIDAGWQELIIDGRRARLRTNPQSSSTGPSEDHGVYEYGLRVANGQTTVLPFTIWLTKIDGANALKIASPTVSEVVLTTPRIPNFEIHIPPGTVINDHDGKVVTEVSITPVPVDRPPFPMPLADFPIFYTAQPGTGYLATTANIGARIHYPNVTKQIPGINADLWHYTSHYRGWYRYGFGTVNNEGTQIIPDPGVSVYTFKGASFGFGGGVPPTIGPKCEGPGCKCCDPVDTQTGLFVHRKTDLVVPDVLPINITRTYRNEDSNIRAFGRGSTLEFDMFFIGDNVNYSWAELIQPDGGRIKYNRLPPIILLDINGAVLEATENPQFYKSRVTWNGTGWDLKLTDGTVYVLGEKAPVQSIRDRNGNQLTVTRTMGQKGNITRITASPSGRYLDFTYDASNRISQITDNGGRTVSYQYDSNSRLWRVTDPMGGVTEYAYDASHRMLSLKDPRGIVYLTNEYTNGKVTKQTQADGSNYQVAYTTDGSGNVTQADVTDPRGNITRSEFNTGGQLIKQTKALGTSVEQVTDYERQAVSGLLLSVTDALEVTPGVRRKTTYTYDAKGNMLTVTRNAQDTNQANWVTTTYEYEPVFNQVKKIVDPLQHVTEFFYDSFGNLLRVKDANNNETTYTYNSQGQPLTVATPAGTTQFVYEFGDLVSVIDPLGNTTNRNLDGIGRLQSITNPLGLTTTYGYDSLNRLRTVADPLNGSAHSTQFDYDPNSNLLSVSDAKTPSGATTYTYNSMDQRVARIDPLLKGQNYQYDIAGNLILFRDQKLQATTYEYDALDRKTKTTYADGSLTTFLYDKSDRLREINDSISGLIIRDYDGLDRLTSEQTPQGTVGYTYDAAGRRSTMTVPGQALISYTYDNGNRLTKITQSSSIVQFGYDNANRRTSLTLPNGILVEYGYDAASRITSITYKQNGTTLLGDLTYEYDKAGNRTKIGGSWARTGMPEPITTSIYDANNRQLSFGDKTLAYDDNGNLQSITDSNGTTLYSWNARNQLVGISGPNVNASFVYDGLGRREQKSINGSLTEFLYDGVTPVQETSGAVVLANILPGLGIDEFLTRTDIVAGVTSNFLTDALGSPVAAADSQGTVQTEYTYESFGRSTNTGVLNTSSYQYTGRENDGLGLYYYRARYYHPALQRFLSEDPIEFGGGDINLYSFVTNNPTNFTDPDGLQAVQQLPKILDALSKAAAAIASAIAAGAAGKAILDRVLRGDREGEGRYYCEAKCTVVVFDPSRSPFKENPKGTHSFGYGYGRTLQLAIKAAKKSADNKIPLGCYNRHCFGIGGDCEGMPISY